MKVFILIKGEDYESYSRLKVVSSYEKAKKLGPIMLGCHDAEFIVVGPFADKDLLGEWCHNESFVSLWRKEVR